MIYTLKCDSYLLIYHLETLHSERVKGSVKAVLKNIFSIIPQYANIFQKTKNETHKSFISYIMEVMAQAKELIAMSIFKRIGAIIKSNKEQPAPPKAANPFEETKVGDIVEVDLEEYIVSGKLIYFDRGFPPHRFAYYLKNGKHISCLLVEKGRTYETFICRFVEGSLDDPNDVPSQLDLGDGVTYELEHHRSDMVRTEGQTDFRPNDQVLIWRYFGQGEQYFFLQWQDGKYVAMEGERTPSGQIKFLRAGS